MPREHAIARLAPEYDARDSVKSLREYVGAETHAAVSQKAYRADMRQLNRTSGGAASHPSGANAADKSPLDIALML